ncbi:MAG: tetratricopeptide repeat protein [Thiobacillaceae bacterium]
MLRDLDARGVNQDQAPTNQARSRAAGTLDYRGNRRKKLTLLGLAGMGVLFVAGSYVSLSLQTQRIAKTSPVSTRAPAEIPPSMISGQQNYSATTNAAPVATPKADVHIAKTTEATHRSSAADQQGMTPALHPATRHAGASTRKPFELTLSATLTNDLTMPLPRQPAQIAIEVSSETLARELCDQANALLHAGKVEAARRKYREALERNPALTEARIQLARSLREGGDTESALSVLKAGYNQQRDDILAVALGRAYAESGQRVEALNWLSLGSGRLGPADFALMGTLLSQEHRYQEAINAYQSALQAEPHKGGWLLGLGLALDNAQRHDEAQVVFRQALDWGEFKPEVVEFLKKRTGVYLQ